MRFTGQIVEVVEVDGDSAIVLRADGAHAFSIYRRNLLPLDRGGWRALSTGYAAAMRATFREGSGHAVDGGGSLRADPRSVLGPTVSAANSTSRHQATLLRRWRRTSC